MKRKLVNYDYFQKLTERSLSNSLKEITESQSYLADILDLDELNVHSFDNSSVIFEGSNGNFYRSEYEVTPKSIKFNDVEELVIDQESENKEAKKILSSMLEAILDEDELKATQYFEEYIELESKRRTREKDLYGESVLAEAYARSPRARAYYSPNRTGGKSQPKISVRTSSTPDPERSRRTKEQWNKYGYKMRQAMKRKRSKRGVYASRHKAGKSVRHRLRSLNAGTAYTGKRTNRDSGKVFHRQAGKTKRHMNEWMTLASQVFNFIDFKQTGTLLTESVEQVDGVLNVTLPNSKVRNEMKLQMMKYDLLKTDFKVLRETAKQLHSDPKFCQMVSDIKRYNNLADNKELEESIDRLIMKYPSVMYLTQEELSRSVAMAMDSSGVTNYDDNTCRFMAEGILRVAQNTYPDKVEKLANLAKVDLTKNEDKFAGFQKAAETFFSHLDESVQLEIKMFEDLLDAALEVRKIAIDSENEFVKNEASDFIAELQDIVDGRSLPSLEVAADVASWLDTIAESNLETEDWEVQKTPYRTVSGDHPQMAKNARKPYSPSSDFDSWSDPAPAVNGEKKGYGREAAEEQRYRSWSNKGGKDVFPDLRNPIVPDAGDFTMKGEKGVDKDDSGLGSWSDSSTFPSLENPYIPAAQIPRQKVDPSNSVE